MPSVTVLQPDWAREFKEVICGCSTRLGGVSPAPYASLNLGAHVDDDVENVAENRKRLFESVGIQSMSLATMNQVHGSTVRFIRDPGQYDKTDGLVTDAHDLILCVNVADCAAVLFFDPVTRLLGACHAGWRGAVSGIVQETLNEMFVRGARPRDIRIWISPRISTQHFEVGEEVARHFDAEDVFRFPGAEKPHVNLGGALIRQLRKNGILHNSIAYSDKCTVSNNDQLFSYRAEKGTTGRMMAFIGLRA